MRVHDIGWLPRGSRVLLGRFDVKCVVVENFEDYKNEGYRFEVIEMGPIPQEQSNCVSWILNDRPILMTKGFFSFLWGMSRSW